jgi:hypothetical protein
MSDAESRSWQQQVADLTAERHRAETAVNVIKRLGGPGDLTTAEIAYGDGRAETEAVIAALTVALEEGKGADPLADLEARLCRAVVAREALAKSALDLAAGSGAKAGLIDLLAPGALTGLVSAIGALWRRGEDRDAATRATIAARLESARWSPFAEIKAQ